MQPEAVSPLSTREQEVLQLIAAGLSNKEIALTLTLSSSTVKRHVESIFKKLHAKNRVEAAVYAARHSSHVARDANKKRNR